MKKYNKLIVEALSTREQAYAPYSSFKVGASLLCVGGDIFNGCNIENVSYGTTICAERVAFSSAIANGKRKFNAIVIVGGRDEVNEFCYPCGACRQFMAEFCSPDFKIVLFDGINTKVVTLGELLPNAFDKSTLK
ncbi:MAG: cytidine deaminase [Clostridia bacterium]|nr:cytidine deaminase [Clostridia bacterium]